MGALPLPRRSSKSPKKLNRAMSKERRRNSGTDSSKKILSKGYVPGDKDVIMGRGKAIQNHPGNIFYRETIEHYLPHYARAKCKLDKSLIVNSVVAAVRESGGFVREESGKWFECSELLVRERIGASLRDLLHSRYSSSTKSKKKRRLQAQDQLSHEVEEILHRQDCKEIVRHLERLSDEIQDDDELQTAFNEANKALLIALKSNTPASYTTTTTTTTSAEVDDSSTRTEESTTRMDGSESKQMDEDESPDDEAPTLMESLSSFVSDFARLAEDGGMEPIPYKEVPPSRRHDEEMPEVPPSRRYDEETPVGAPPKWSWA